MKTPDNSDLTDLELSEMLGTWNVPDPPPSLRKRVFSELKGTPMNIPISAFDLPAAAEEHWYRSFLSNTRSLVHPPELGPLQVTSKPVEVVVSGVHTPGAKGDQVLLPFSSTAGQWRSFCLFSKLLRWFGK